MHVNCDVIGLCNGFFEIQGGGHVLYSVSNFQAFPRRVAFENVSNRTKTVLVTLEARFRRRISHVPNVIPIWIDSNY